MKQYHFCAMAQTPSGNLNYFNGTMKSNEDFMDIEKYDELRREIGKLMDPPVEKPILLSLTVI